MIRNEDGTYQGYVRVGRNEDGSPRTAFILAETQIDFLRIRYLLRIGAWADADTINSPYMEALKNVSKKNGVRRLRSSL
jgi:hypothetical protein